MSGTNADGWMWKLVKTTPELGVGDATPSSVWRSRPFHKLTWQEARARSRTKARRPSVGRAVRPGWLPKKIWRQTSQSEIPERFFSVARGFFSAREVRTQNVSHVRPRSFRTR